MEIERLWSKDIGWFLSKGKEEQSMLLAWYRVYLNPDLKPKNTKKGKLHKKVEMKDESASNFWLGG